jgi:protein-disulfide isomerase
MTQAEVEKIVHEYIVNNPEVLVEASMALRQKQFEEQQRLTAEAAAQNANTLLTGACLEVGETVNPEVTVVEFFDYQCVHCVRSHTAVKGVLALNSDVRVIYHQLPILGEVSAFAAKAVIAADSQGKCLALHNALMERDLTTPLTEEMVLDLARRHRIDIERLRTDMETPAIGRQIADSIQLS